MSSLRRSSATRSWVDTASKSSRAIWPVSSGRAVPGDGCLAELAQQLRSCVGEDTVQQGRDHDGEQAHDVGGPGLAEQLVPME
jgi:hypothetical protein